MSNMPGWASRDPLKLCPCVRAKWVEFVTRVQFAVVLIETLRDAERQAYYRAIGVSRTVKSKHLPQPPNGLSLAFDVCPKDYLRMKGWNPGGPLWSALSGYGVDAGLYWGGDWKTWKDRPHFYQEKCSCAQG